MYCDAAKPIQNGGFEFETKSWGPPNLTLQAISQKLKEHVSKIIDENYGYKNKVNNILSFI